MAITSLTISAGAMGYVASSGGAGYELNRQGLGQTLDLTAGGLLVGQSTGAVYEAFSIFDTSSIPDNAIILDARLALTLFIDFSLTEFTIQARNYDFGNSISASDFINVSTLQGKPIVATMETLQFGALQEYSFIGSKALIDMISKTGQTRIAFNSSRQITGNEPTGNEYSIFTAAKLYITYDTPVTPVPNTPKTYEFKLYNKVGTYLETITGVGSEVSFIKEINTAGGDAKIILNRPVGELTNIEFGYGVEIYCFDKEVPNGQVIYKGKITRYGEDYSDNQKLEINLESFGTELSHFVLEAATSETTDQNQATQDTTFDLTTSNQVWLAQSFVPAGSPLTSVDLYFSRFESPCYLAIYTDNGGQPGTQLSVVLLVNAPAGASTKFAISPALSLTVGATYWIVIKSLGAVKGSSSFTDIINYKDTTNPYGAGILRSSTNAGSSWTTIANADLYFTTYYGTYNTTLTYTDRDPAAIFKDILDKYRASGGTLNYYNSGIEPTNTTATYTFKNSTILDALQTVLSFCPFGFYWYVDQATNYIYLRKRTAAAEVFLAFGRHIQSLQPIRILDNLVNVVYFTGGELSPGVNFYQKFTNQSSVNFYGLRAAAVTDNRVTLTATATKIANRILEANNAPELRTRVTILDSDPFRDDNGYDLEALPLGAMQQFTNVGAASPPLWDVAEWDVAYWDYNLKQLATLTMQIVRIEYNSSHAVIGVSSIPQDISKLVDEALREINKIQTLDNPAAPS